MDGGAPGPGLGEVCGEPGDKFAIAFEEIEFGQLVSFGPENLFELIIDGYAGELGDVVEDEFDRRALVVLELIALKDFADVGLNAEFFAEFAGKGYLRGFARFDFATWELPFEAMPIVTLALADQDFASVCDDAGYDANSFRHETDSLSRIRGNGGELKETLYHSKLLDHFSHPRNAGELEAPSYRISCENPVCGDQLRLTVQCAEGRIERVGFLARGCTASIACASALTELLSGRRREELKGVGPEEVEAAVGELAAESKHAAVLCAEAVKQLEAAWKSS